MERLTTRRDFLRAATATFTTLSVGCQSPQKSPLPEVKPFPSMEPLPTATPSAVKLKHNRLVEEIQGYQAFVGITNPAAELKEALRLNLQDWNSPKVPFQNTFPDYLLSYGYLSQFYAQTLVTPHVAEHLFYGAHIDPSFTAGYIWDYKAKRLHLSTAVAEGYWTAPREDGWSIYGILGHEIGGHMPDTRWLARTYPLDTFLAVDHGKWRMQKEAYNIKGNIVENNPNWQLNYSLPRDLGGEVAKDYVLYKPGEGNLSAQDYAKVDSIANLLAADIRVTIEQLRFNKANCLRFGRLLLADIRAGKILSSGPFHEKYTSMLSNSFYEVFAEMMRSIMVNPDLVNGNAEILAGGQEIFSALRADAVSVDKLRIATQQTPDFIQKMWEEERRNYRQTPSITEVMEKSPGVDPIALEVEKAYQELVEKGSSGLPTTSIDQDDLSVIVEYSDAVSRVCSHYPELSNLDPSLNRGIFDPIRLAMWDAEKVDAAINPHRIRAILQSRITSTNTTFEEGERQKIIQDTQVLQTFISSDAFGT